jgi:uncharacterized membrane protein (DUF485 family)
MPLDVLPGAVLQLAAMLAVAGGYFAASRRYRVLQHPLSIVLFVTCVGVVVAVAGAVYRVGWSAVPAMARRSAIGSAGWGVILAAAAWSVRWVLAKARS